MVTPNHPEVLGETGDSAFGEDVEADPSAGRRPRWRARRIWAVVVVLVLTGLVVAAAVVPLPYYAFTPGTVRDTEPLIAIEGDVETFPSEGSISFTTVSLRQVTLFGRIQAWFDDDVEIRSRDEVRGNRSEEENRTFNLQLMDNSKNVAAQVALEHLGYQVDVTANGASVLEVSADSPADGVLEVGDTVVALGDEPLDHADELRELMRDEKPGDSISVTVESRDGRQREVAMTLAPAPDDPDRGIMGVVVQPRDLQYDFPVDVEIDTGDVGGPSAGLSFTLAILDDLTPGDLTGGEPIAVTGEILEDGTVGPVGGTGQKAAAVRDAGIDVLIVPTADEADAEAHAGDVEVIGVDTLDEALEALAGFGGNATALPQVGEEQAASPGEPDAGG
jgi:PDZ domain-containing protein